MVETNKEAPVVSTKNEKVEEALKHLENNNTKNALVNDKEFQSNVTNLVLDFFLKTNPVSSNREVLLNQTQEGKHLLQIVTTIVDSCTDPNQKKQFLSSKQGLETRIQLLKNNTPKTSAEIHAEIIDNIPIAVSCAKQAYENILRKRLSSKEEKYLQEKLGNLYPIYENLSKGLIVDTNNIKAIDFIRQTIIDMKMPSIQKEYKRLLPPNTVFPGSMPHVDFLGTGDGSGTNGLDNTSYNSTRWLFDYKINEKNTISSSSRVLEFGIEDRPMSLAFTWFGEDKVNWSPVSGGAMELVIVDNSTTYRITWVYKDGKITIASSKNLPKDITIDTEKNIVTIPKTYKGSKITLTTESAKYGTKKDGKDSYDEVAFIVASDNVSSLVSSGQVANIGNDIKIQKDIGKFILTDKEQKNISSEVDVFLKQIPYMLTKPASLSITAMGDETDFDMKKIDTTINEYNAEYTTLYDKFKTDTIIKPIIDTMSNLINNSKVFVSDKQRDPKEITAQRLLLKNRFVVALDQALKNPKFKDAVANGEVTITSNIEISPTVREKGGRWTKITIHPITYIKTQ